MKFRLMNLKYSLAVTNTRLFLVSVK